MRVLKSLTAAVLCLSLHLSLTAQEADDQVVISKCTDDYVIAMEDQQPVVKNNYAVTFLSCRDFRTTAYASVLYGNTISLDRATGSSTRDYSNVTPENVFYDDSKLCTMMASLSKRGKTDELLFSRTFHDIKYFTRVFLLEDYYVKNKTVTITIPKTLKGYRLKEMNFRGYPIVSAHSETPTADVYTYTLTDARREKDDPHMPPTQLIRPYVLVLGSFPSVGDFYKWSQQMSAVDTSSADEYMEDNEGKSDQTKRAKLAVPNLQVGDLIDVFVYKTSKVKDENVDPQKFFFIAAHPMMGYRVHCVIDPKFCVQYRTLNGAPDFAESKDEDGNIVLDAAVKNVDRTVPDYGYNPMLMSPLTLVTISGKLDYGYAPKSTKDKGLHANPSAEVIQNDAWNMLDFWAKVSKFGMPKKAVEQVKGIKQLKTDEEKADYLYNYFILWSLTHGRAYTAMTKFNAYFRFFMKKYGVQLDNVLLTDGYSEPIDQLASYGNAIWGVRTKGGKTYFPTQAGADASTVPYQFQGRHAIVSTGKKAASGPFQAYTIPESTAADNVDKTVINAGISGTSMNISRTESLTSNFKIGMIPLFASSDQIAKAWGGPYGVTSYADLVYNRKADNYAQEMAEEDKKFIEENFKKEVEGYHSRAPQSISKTAVTDFGEPGKPFTYAIDYTMDGMVKRAGNNLVVSVGELVGKQSHIEGEARQRDCDVFHRYPCTYDVEIALQIPSGYHVAKESLSGLTNNIDNTAAAFSSSAKVEGNTLRVTYHKVYKQTLVKLANWPDELKVLDAAFKFSTAQIVLRKN